MRKIILLTGLILAVLSPAWAEEMVRLPFGAVYHVAPGDTLMSIASQDYMKVYLENRGRLAETDRRGRANPNRIAAGTPLHLSKGTYVTSRTAEAINARRESRRRVL